MPRKSGIISHSKVVDQKKNAKQSLGVKEYKFNFFSFITLRTKALYQCYSVVRVNAVTN